MTMTMRPLLVWAVPAAALVVGLAAGFGVGRGSAPPHDRGWAQGYDAGYDEGVTTGRALQATQALPAETKDAANQAYRSGYVAGENDAFGNYDGGWALDTPYVVVLEKGLGGATYRFASRTQLAPQVSYRLCASQPSQVCRG